MNLKNSKFFKRIQELRRLSKDKIRKEKNRGVHIDFELESALKERNGDCVNSVQQKGYNANEKLKGEKYDPSEHSEKNQDVSDGLIQLNNVCFRLKCASIPKSSQMSRDDQPNISSIKGSICVSNSRYSMIGRVSKTLGFKVVKEAKLWNILWTDTLPGVEVYKSMKRFQQINHYPGMMEICRKDLLSRNLNRMLKLFPRDYKIFPKTWIFPADYGDALNYANNNYKNKARTFIIKPDSGAMGRGIWLTNDLKSINPSERMICQTYINKPLLIDGYKFDLRVYTLITSVDPLRIFVYNEGLARFATSKYVEPTTENSCDLFMHLTNYSVNKRSSQYDLCDNDDCGSKRKFCAINNWLRRRNYEVDEFWQKIDDIIIKTVLSAWPMLKHNYHACFPSHDKIQACFEILGFDILVDSKMKPYVLEVNHSPSYHTHELVDRQVKKALIRDTLLMVSTPLADKKQILREDRKRIKQRLLKVHKADTTLNSQRAAAATNTENNSSAKTGDEPPLLEEGTHDAGLSALSQQIAWEESHLGDFRRVMPPHDPDRLNYYCQFFALQNQASIYGETAASKKREEVAKKMRLEIEEKRQRQLEVLSGQRRRMKLEERRRKRASMPRAIVERHRLSRFRAQENWTPGFISEAEERLRRTWMQMRSEILRNNKIVQMIYKDFYNGGNLTNADIITYPELYRCLERGADVMSE
ncbi:PREDICTED: tubulin polyglutamylase TTLL13P isoform X1 [Bactrocera latifrons]|uniref:Tubulin polyglutamylase ttll6 n=2 Tax=Bactrocera latifrons TaxID=174628 RepID=A0A0K8TWY6_BACLA|nr:PREDICTED: tubulin polyglutamylase TTLL13P isoform X1 [Bactrocera latifrons]